MKIIAIAPMLDWTDRHYRYFMRQITKHTEQYTEMVVADAVLHGNLSKILEYSQIERPLAIQLGGSDPKKLASASKICQDYGYNSINLNVGCPSDRVKAGNFGACLMQNPQLVADCINSMISAVNIPVSVKHRIGLDYIDDYDVLYNFVKVVSNGGCNRFIVHARNAVLNGLSPKQNRTIPPLRYEYVYRLKQDFPHLQIVINGGISSLTAINEHLKYVDGVMLGREAYHNPFLFATIDGLFFESHADVGEKSTITRQQVAQNMLEYLIDAQKQNIPLYRITRHMIGLYHGRSKAKLWRNGLTNLLIKTNSIDTYINLLSQMEE